jgi:hypothetical protein
LIETDKEEDFDMFMNRLKENFSDNEFLGFVGCNEESIIHKLSTFI